MKAEKIAYTMIQLSLLPSQKVTTGRGLQPPGQTYTERLFCHESDRVPAFDDDIPMLHDGRKAPVANPGETAPVIRAHAAQRLQLAGILVTDRRGDRDRFAGAQPARPRGTVSSDGLAAFAAQRQWKNQHQ